MAELSFETLTFNEEADQVKVTLLNQFYFSLNQEELQNIAPFSVTPHRITFSEIPQDRAEKKFHFLLDKGLKELKSHITNHPAVYIHQNSGIPLLGNVAFGLVYRNTTLIEIKPMTGCNLNCIYCSVGEGIHSQKTDFVIEKDYLVQEFQKLMSFVQKPVEAHIGTHGEPFLYGDIIPLIRDLHALKSVHTVSLDTNGTLLSKKLIDQLTGLKKVRLNISLNTLNPRTAQTIAGVPYRLDKLLEVIKYAKNKVSILLTPLIVPTYNDSEIEDLVRFAKENHFEIGIQNFLTYKTGRNPVKPWPWEKFYSLLKKSLQPFMDTKVIP